MPLIKDKCANCGFNWGSHHGGTSPWPRDYCPGHEDIADWKNGPGTVFKPMINEDAEDDPEGGD